MRSEPLGDLLKKEWQADQQASCPVWRFRRAIVEVVLHLQSSPDRPMQRKQAVALREKVHQHVQPSTKGRQFQHRTSVRYLRIPVLQERRETKQSPRSPGNRERSKGGASLIPPNRRTGAPLARTKRRSLYAKFQFCRTSEQRVCRGRQRFTIRLRYRRSRIQGVPLAVHPNRSNST